MASLYPILTLARWGCLGITWIKSAILPWIPLSFFGTLSTLAICLGPSGSSLFPVFPKPSRPQVNLSSVSRCQSDISLPNRAYHGGHNILRITQDERDIPKLPWRRLTRRRGQTPYLWGYLSIKPSVSKNVSQMPQALKAGKVPINIETSV